jgi:hypothetical protein
MVWLKIDDGERSPKNLFELFYGEPKPWAGPDDLTEVAAAIFDVSADMLRPATPTLWRSLHQVELRRAQRYRRWLVALGVAEAVTLFVAALGWWL